MKARFSLKKMTYTFTVPEEKGEVDRLGQGKRLTAKLAERGVPASPRKVISLGVGDVREPNVISAEYIPPGSSWNKTREIHFTIPQKTQEALKSKGKLEIPYGAYKVILDNDLPF